MFVHVTLVPYLSFADEMKSKPSQHSVKELLSLGIKPDALVCRTERPLEEGMKDKLAEFCHVKRENVIENMNVDCLYEIPLILEDEKFADIVCKKLQLEPEHPPELDEWRNLVERYKNATGEVKIGLICKYELRDAYLSVFEALEHAGIALGVKIKPTMIHSKGITDSNAAKKLAKLNGILIPGGYGERDMPGLISAAKYARQNNIPFLGIGLGMHCAIIEFARNVAGMDDAGSIEENKDCLVPLIIEIPRPTTTPSLETDGNLPMRKGAQPCKLIKESHIYTAYDTDLIYERFRHMYKLNNQYRGELKDKGLIETALSPDDQHIEAIELPTSSHPWFVGVQFRPEFKSRINKPSPIFEAFLKAALGKE